MKWWAILALVAASPLAAGNKATGGRSAPSGASLSEKVERQKAAWVKDVDQSLSARWSQLQADPETAHLSRDQLMRAGLWMSLADTYGYCISYSAQGEAKAWLDSLAAVGLGNTLEVKTWMRGNTIYRSTSTAGLTDGVSETVKRNYCAVAIEAARQVVAQSILAAPSQTAINP